MNQLAAKKAYEISYALFRVAGTVASKDLAAVLERLGTVLMERVLEGNWDAALEAVDKSVYFLRLGRDVGHITHTNVSVLEHELERFRASVKEFRESRETLPELHLESYFSAPISGIVQEKHDGNSPGKEQRQSRQSTQVAGSEESFAGQSERQEIILGVIRGSGTVRTKEIQERLPDVSERTLRYDLQKLLERRAIERIGGGGPATSYRLRTSESALLNSATPTVPGAPTSL